MNVWVVLPTYNEISNLALMVTTLLERIQWRQTLPLSVPGQVSLPPTETRSPLAAERSGLGSQPPGRPRATGRQIEGWGEANTPSPLAGEGWGEANTPSPLTGEGWGEANTPSPLAGEGWGEGDAQGTSNGRVAHSELVNGQNRYLGPGSSDLAAPRVFILIVDDDSPDGTGALADQLAQEHSGRIRVLHRARKLGLGTAYRAGFAIALENGADVAIEMDADFSHSPAYLPAMLTLLQDHDVVVGSRWAPGGSLDESWEAWRYLLSKYANVYARWVTGLDVRDTTAGFKAFRADALRKLPLQRVRSDGYAFQIEMATACQHHGLRVAELPIHFEERVRGKSKMSWRIICEAAWRVWQIKFRW